MNKGNVTCRPNADTDFLHKIAGKLHSSLPPISLSPGGLVRSS